MFLYHGSNMLVDCPRLMPLARALDFGAGFYLTTSFEQAAKWARTTVLRRTEGIATVSVFQLEEVSMAHLKILRFNEPDSAWLRFVSRNRNERIDDSDFDMVVGPVANDNTMPVLNLYFSGAYTEEEALRRLLPQRLKDQYALKTQAALAALHFIEGKMV